MREARLMPALKTGDQIRITVVGRKTGRKISLPVWFVLEGERLMLMPVLGTGTNWYKNLQKKPAIVVSAGGATLSPKPTLTTDSARVKEIAEKFRAKYGASYVKRYYPKLDACVKIPLG